MMKTAWNT